MLVHAWFRLPLGFLSKRLLRGCVLAACMSDPRLLFVSEGGRRFRFQLHSAVSGFGHGIHGWYFFWGRFELCVGLWHSGSFRGPERQ